MIAVAQADMPFFFNLSPEMRNTPRFVSSLTELLSVVVPDYFLEVFPNLVVAPWSAILISDSIGNSCYGYRYS